jgi:hypothetical protein
MTAFWAFAQIVNPRRQNGRKNWSLPLEVWTPLDLRGSMRQPLVISSWQISGVIVEIFRLNCNPDSRVRVIQLI